MHADSQRSITVVSNLSLSLSALNGSQLWSVCVSWTIVLPCSWNRREQNKQSVIYSWLIEVDASATSAAEDAQQANQAINHILIQNNPIFNETHRYQRNDLIR